MRLRGRHFLCAVLCAALAACATTPRAPDPDAERTAIAARLMRDIEVLASDEFGGRKPGTVGEERTVAYLVERMRETGLVSGTNDPGSAWRAPVELVSTTPLESRITVRTRRGAFEMPQESSAAYAFARRALIDGVEVVFVGRGTQDIPASELNGKIVVKLQDGQFPGPRAALFEADPAAMLVVVPSERELEAERLRYEQEKLFLASEESDRLIAFVTQEAFARALPPGLWDRLLAEAAKEDFRIRRMEATIAIDAQSRRREFTSFNVIGMIPGQLRGAGAVVLMSHWDHLGECAPGTPDPICNGAVDNASGVALMLELARRLKASGPFDRDIYFLSTSAEEAGLLGARAFAAAPPMPLDTIVAAFNFDTVAAAQPGGAFGFVGEGRTSLDAVVLDVLRERRGELGNRDFAESFLRRHDGWVLLEKGVPSVLISTAFASEIVLGPYLAADYHRPSDEIDRIELGGAIDDLLLHEELVRRVASTARYPGAVAAVAQ
ncbi:MAG: M20/M25/M40 family metallo-hydrolase [Erythrobacter sp.]|jgi:hypothetical protein|nr:M20/M25/M40 family metallo-hydrolase [Erythrobacter sp.]